MPNKICTSIIRCSNELQTRLWNIKVGLPTNTVPTPGSSITIAVGTDGVRLQPVRDRSGRGRRVGCDDLRDRRGRRRLARSSGGWRRRRQRHRRLWLFRGEASQMSGVPGPTVGETVRGGADALGDSYRRREPASRLRSVSRAPHADVVTLCNVRRHHSVPAVVRRLVGLLPAQDTRRQTCVVLS